MTTCPGQNLHTNLKGAPINEEALPWPSIGFSTNLIPTSERDASSQERTILVRDMSFDFELFQVTYIFYKICHIISSFPSFRIAYNHSPLFLQQSFQWKLTVVGTCSTLRNATVIILEGPGPFFTEPLWGEVQAALGPENTDWKLQLFWDELVFTKTHTSSLTDLKYVSSDFE